MHSIEKLKSMGISMTADMILNHPQALRFLDLKLGNICNLKCRICGSFSSSKWAAEEIAIYSKNKTARDNLANGRWIRESDRFWADLREIIEDVKYFEFTGGEPFLIDEHFDLLAAAVMMGHAQKIEIHYNTNTTVVPKIGLELWPHFKQVEIALSIDDLADRFEYQRYGTRWADTLSNLYTFQQLRANSKNITLQICCTVNVQNIFYLDEMCEWISQQGFDFVYFNVLHSMEHYCIKYLPKRAKQIISDKFHNYTGPYTEDVRGLLSFMWQGDDDRSSDLIRVLRQSDQQRNQHFRDSHPEMAEAIGYD
jgi:MoaA/NifB/PqqE/SkfB family radical SAM enzyme